MTNALMRLSWQLKICLRRCCTPANAGNTGSIRGLQRSHMPSSDKAHLPELLSLCSRARELQPLSPCAKTTGYHTRRSLCATEGEASPTRSPHATARRSPCSHAPEPVCHRRRSHPYKKPTCHSQTQPLLARAGACVSQKEKPALQEAHTPQPDAAPACHERRARVAVQT